MSMCLSGRVLSGPGGLYISHGAGTGESGRPGWRPGDGRRTLLAWIGSVGGLPGSWKPWKGWDGKGLG